MDRITEVCESSSKDIGKKVNNLIPFYGAIFRFDINYILDYLNIVLEKDEKWTIDNMETGIEELFDDLSIKLNEDILFFNTDSFLFSDNSDKWCFAISQQDYNENISSKGLRLVLFDLLKTLDLVEDSIDGFDSIITVSNIIDMEKL